MTDVSRQYPDEVPDQSTVFGGTPVPPAGSETTALEEQGLIGPGVKPSYWQNVFNRGSQMIHESPTAAAVRAGIVNDRLTEEMLASKSPLEQVSPVDLNTRYPGMPIPFKEPMYDTQAKFLWEDQQRQQRLKAWMSKGPDIGFWGDLAAGVPLVADPLNMALFGGLSAGARAAGVTARLAGPGLTRALGRVGLTLGENYAGNLAGEEAGRITSVMEHKEVPPLDLVAPIGGALVGTGLHYATHGMGYLFEKARETQTGVPGPTQRKGVMDAVKHEESGSRIDMTPLTELQGMRDRGEVTGGARSRYEYQRLNDPHATDFYIAIDPDGRNMTRASREFGGTTGVQNPERANNIAGVPESEHQGQVIRARLHPDAKVASGEQGFLDAVHPTEKVSPAYGREEAAYGGRKQFEEAKDAALERLKGIVGDPRKWKIYGPVFEQAIDNKATVGDVFNAFSRLGEQRITPENVFHSHDLNKVMEGLGYDGIQSTAYHEGEPIDNQVHVWNEDHFQPLDVVPGDRSTVPTYQDLNSDLLKTQEPEQAHFYDADANQKIEEAAVTPERQIEPEDHGVQADEKPKSEAIKADHEERVKEVVNSLKALAEEPGNEHIGDAMADIDQDFKRDQLEIEAARKMSLCMTENMT